MRRKKTKKEGGVVGEIKNLDPDTIKVFEAKSCIRSQLCRMSKNFGEEGRKEGRKGKEREREQRCALSFCSFFFRPKFLFVPLCDG